MSQIQILDKTYEVLGILEKITVADSFVVPSNKIGGGNGEAKLYVGQNNEITKAFFGERGFDASVIITKNNLLHYLNNIYSEYFEPSQNYRERNRLSELWEERYNNINKLDDIIYFRVQDQNQLSGPRVYINAVNELSHKTKYSILRELPLPIISYFNIYKLRESNFNIVYYISLHLNGYENSLNEVDKVNNNIDRYIPFSEDNDDIEKELQDETIDLKIPIDTNKVKVRTTPSTIGQIIYDLEDNFINLNTEFQRRPDLWKPWQKSRFIESLLLKLPIPAFYFNEKEENELEVIDGLQRISTIKGFVINQNFKLSHLEFLQEYNDCYFSDLPSTFQRRIKTFAITVYIIEKGTPDAVKYNIFKRVNTGGLKLTEQEIRHAINQGKPANLIADLVRGEDDLDEHNQIRIRKKNDSQSETLNATDSGVEFVKATDNRIGTNRMEDRDFATRFVSFYLINYRNYEPNLDTFLNSGMAKIRELDEIEISTLKKNFENSMRLAFDVFGNDAFRKRFNASDARKPINKALFEVLSVLFAQLNEQQRVRLMCRKTVFKEKFILLHNNLNFLRAITQGTAMKESVFKRFQEIERIIKETIDYD
jgi:hypothetical protein